MESHYWHLEVSCFDSDAMDVDKLCSGWTARSSQLHGKRDADQGIW
jgi:hypothetical protein